MTDRLAIDALHPELRRTYRRSPAPPVRYGWQRRMTRVGMRLMPVRRPTDGTTHRFVPLGPSAGVHVFTPASGGSGAALLWIHGGGMVIGAAVQDHRRCAELARELDLVVVSVEYRLAPEHPYPGPLDDCHAAWNWTLDHAADLGVDPARIAVGGQSAGGGLAAGLVLRLHDEGGTQPAAQWLFCPMLDDRTAADRSLDGVRHYLWNNRANLVGWSAYLAAPPGSDHVPPYAAPARREDLTGLPPAWIGTGDVDLFCEEDRDYALRLQRDGVPCELDIVTGAPHAFESMAAESDVARAYNARAETWLAARLGSEQARAA